MQEEEKMAFFGHICLINPLFGKVGSTRETRKRSLIPCNRQVFY